MSLTNIKTIEKQEVVYGFYNLITQKWYIGSTFDLKDRITRHLYYLKHNCHHSQKLQRSFNKYGIDNFQLVILQNCNNFSSEDLTSTEEKYIKLFNSFKNGYNMTDVCSTYYKFKLSEDQINKSIKNKKIPVVVLDKNNNFIKEYESVIAAAKDLKSESTNISQACNRKNNRTVRGFVLVYKSEYDPTFDYTYTRTKKSSNHIQKIKRAAKNNSRNRKVYNIDKYGNVLHTYSSIRELALLLGLTADGLRKYYRKSLKFVYDNKIYLVDKSHIKKQSEK